MSREVKFRAVIDKNTTIFFTLMDLTEQHLKFSIRELLIPWLEAGNIPDIYTWRKDKNDTEIYEGDTVRLGPGYTYKIENLERFFWAMYDDQMGIDFTKSEVIDNTHENPEDLL